MVTKPILGLLFLQLEADGVVDLHDRINDVPTTAPIARRRRESPDSTAAAPAGAWIPPN
jgi:CubicO group peptidase (beta-lactamase class C family)